MIIFTKTFPLNWFSRLFKKELRTIAPGRFLYPLKALGGILFPSWSSQRNIDAFLSSVDVYSVISRIAENTAAVPLLTYKKTNDKKAFKEYLNKGLHDPMKSIFRVKALEVLPETDPLNELLMDPGGGLTQREFVELLSILYLACGEVFIYKMRTGESRGSRVIQMHIFAGPDVALRVTNVFPYQVIGYDFHYDGKAVLQNVPPKDVIHIKKPNPRFNLNGEHLRGLSPLTVGNDLLEAIDVGEQRRKATVKNGSIPAIIFLDNETDAPDYDKWRESYQKFVEQPENNGVPFPINGKVGLLQTGMKALDMQLMENVGLNFKKLCNLFHISDILFNSDVASTESNVQEMVKLMYTNACMPLADAIKDGLNRGLVDDNTKYINFDFSTVPALQKDMVKMMNAVAAMPVSLTGNQLYELMGFEKSDLPEMDKPLLKQGYTFIDDNIVLPGIDENI